MTDQSDDEFDHDNLVERKVGIVLCGCFRMCVFLNLKVSFGIFILGRYN